MAVDAARARARIDAACALPHRRSHRHHHPAERLVPMRIVDPMLAPLSRGRTLLRHHEQFAGIFVPLAELDTIEEGYTRMNIALKNKVEFYQANDIKTIEDLLEEERKKNWSASLQWYVFKICLRYWRYCSSAEERQIVILNCTEKF